MSKEWRDANIDKARAWEQEYRARRLKEDAVAVRMYAAGRMRASRDANPEETRQKQRERYAKNKERISAQSKAKRLARGEIGPGGRNGWASKLYHGAIGSSARRGHLPPDITKDAIVRLWEAQDGKCFWLGVPMDKKPRSPWKVSLERINNSMGYVEGNLVLCCWLANRARGELTIGAFEEALETLRQALNSRVSWS